MDLKKLYLSKILIWISHIYQGSCILYMGNKVNVIIVKKS